MSREQLNAEITRHVEAESLLPISPRMVPVSSKGDEEKDGIKDEEDDLTRFFRKR